MLTIKYIKKYKVQLSTESKTKWLSYVILHNIKVAIIYFACRKNKIEKFFKKYQPLLGAFKQK